MAATVDEIELKYDVPPGLGLPRLADLPEVAAQSGPDEQSLEAEYFDTADLRLLRARITLRQRRGGSDEGWHLKLPAGPDARREIQLPLSHRGPARSPVPKELAALVRVHTRGAPLRPVAIIRTRRQRQLLLDDAGSALAELVADEVSAETLGDSTTISQWHEVEVELKGGGRKLLEAADERLRGSGLRRSANSAKLERALAGQFPPRPDEGQEKLTGGSPAGDVVLAFLRAQVSALTTMDPLVRRDEPDAVHQMRICARRLRSALQAFGSLLDGQQHLMAEAELKWLSGMLGAPRDNEVLAARIERQLHETPAELVMGPVDERVRLHFAPVAAEGRKALLAALDSKRYFRLLDGLDQLIAAPPLKPTAARPAAEVLPRLVSRAYRRTARRMRRVPQAPSGQAREVALHDTRKAAKRARYAAEAVSPALGGQAKRFARKMKKVTSVLGDHQDAVVARGVDRELGVSTYLGGENAFTFGLLYERDNAAALRLQDQAQQAWRRSSRPKYRRWMRP